MHLIQNEAAEQYVLGAILYEPELMDSCTLTAKEFYRERHQIIFSAYEAIAKKEKRIIPQLVLQVVGEDRISVVGGIKYLSQLAGSIATTADFEMNEKIVHDDYCLRRLAGKCGAFAENPHEDAVLELQRDIDSYINAAAEEDEEQPDREALLELMSSLDDDQGEISGITTGSTDLDRMTNGLQEGELIIVAARPSVGKSAFVLNVGLSAAKSGAFVDLFSLEMPKKDIMKRALSVIGNVNGLKWHNPRRLMNVGDFHRLSTASGIYSDLSLRIHDAPSQTVMSIQSIVRKSFKDHPDQKHLVIVDYLDFIKAVGKFDRTDEKIGSISKGLKRIARKYELPIILVCQLNRGVEHQQDKRPSMSDLKNSGDLEQDADMILLLYRDDYYKKDSNRQNIAEIIVDKQRNGPTGTVEMEFIKEYGKFCDIDRHHQSIA